MSASSKVTHQQQSKSEVPLNSSGANDVITIGNLRNPLSIINNGLDTLNQAVKIRRGKSATQSVRGEFKKHHNNFIHQRDNLNNTLNDIFLWNLTFG